MPDPETLQAKWKQLYSKILPAKAKARDSAQKRWPVTLDHCFARNILDKVVGEGQAPWTKRLKNPAIKHMTESQLQSCIELAEEIEHGKANLEELDKESLKVRGTGQQKYKTEPGFRTTETGDNAQDLAARCGYKRKASEGDIDTAFSGHKATKKRQSTLSFARDGPEDISRSDQPNHAAENGALLRKVDAHQTLTPYRKRLYSTLLSVPRGRYTTYAAMSDYLKSSARAVGNGMRNNPFAPEVPCHRVLAADRSIGGFGGSWGKDGKYSERKLDLLAEEGVKFDSRGKAIGDPFRDFGRVS
ncbi:MAG: hypothetical protein Q9160_007907 [Pyrenula sp. 1 TL-2023]